MDAYADVLAGREPPAAERDVLKLVCGIGTPVIHAKAEERKAEMAEDLMRAGIAAAEAEPRADRDLLFRHAYVDPPGNIRRG